MAISSGGTDPFASPEVLADPSGGSDPSGGRRLMGHPPGLFLLFMVEMWERFSYYGMRGILVLYLISVMAAHQLKPGVHTDTLVFEEFAIVDGKTQEQPYATREFSAHLVVDQGEAPATVPAAEGAPIVVLERMRWARGDPAAPNDSKESQDRWVPDESPDAVNSPLVFKGSEGDKKSFEAARFAYRLSNPTDTPIEVHAAIRRWAKDDKEQKQPPAPTRFTVNDGVGTTTITLKPQSERTADDDDVIVECEANTHDSGRNWTEKRASTLYGWYTGLAYLFPILGGIIADRLIGTHKSMLVGGVLISIGHVILGISGFGNFAQSREGLALFILGLAVIVLGTGHFKPCVSVMVGQLYKQGDPKRDSAFTIFYMGINLGAFICAFVVGTLGEMVGWHWGFGAAAVGMLAGLAMYMIGRPKLLAGIGEAPKAGSGAASVGFLIASLVLSAGFAAAYYFGAMDSLNDMVAYLQKNSVAGWTVIGVLLAAILGWTGWFVASNAPQDRGPVTSIFLFMFFNAFFWIAFEQAGSSVNVFTKESTDRMIGGYEVPATWFQSVNSGLIILLAPFFSAMWPALARRRMNPSQPAKIGLGLIFLGLGYLFMLYAGLVVKDGSAKAGMWLVLMMYFWHTVGELCLSPTGLSYVTKAAPAKFVSLLMGIWFVSSFIANLGGGLIAAQVENIEKGVIKLPWKFGGTADFFFLFVVSSLVPGILILLATPWLKKLMRSSTD